MKAAPQLDAAALAERAARHAKRDQLAEARAARARQARDDKQRLADEKRAAVKAEGVKAELPKRTEAELKAACDARYAARKARR